jgi:hypothetical protein
MTHEKNRPFAGNVHEVLDSSIKDTAVNLVASSSTSSMQWKRALCGLQIRHVEVLHGCIHGLIHTNMHRSIN